MHTVGWSRQCFCEGQMPFTKKKKKKNQRKQHKANPTGSAVTWSSSCSLSRRQLGLFLHPSLESCHMAAPTWVVPPGAVPGMAPFPADITSWHRSRVLETGWAGREGGFFSEETPPSALHWHLPACQGTGQRVARQAQQCNPQHGPCRHQRPVPGDAWHVGTESQLLMLRVFKAGGCWFNPASAHCLPRRRT